MFGGVEGLQGMDNAWDVAQDGEEDIDEQVGITPSLEENTEWGQYNCQDDLADVAMFHRVRNAISRHHHLKRTQDDDDLPSSERHVDLKLRSLPR